MTGDKGKGEMEQLVHAASWWREIFGAVLVFFGSLVGIHIRADIKTRDRVIHLERTTISREEVRQEIANIRESMSETFEARFDGLEGHIKGVHEDVRTLINRELSR